MKGKRYHSPKALAIQSNKKIFPGIDVISPQLNDTPLVMMMVLDVRI